MKLIRGSEVFWEAAIDIFEGSRYGCCPAIYKQTRIGLSNEAILFIRMFRPKGITTGYWMSNGYYQEKKNREHRVWAMLFMEQIWKDEYE